MNESKSESWHTWISQNQSVDQRLIEWVSHGTHMNESKSESRSESWRTAYLLCDMAFSSCVTWHCVTWHFLLHCTYAKYTVPTLRSWQAYAQILASLMMMIAFITIKSSLVPLIEGLCIQGLGSMRSNLGIKVWDYRWFAFTSFACLFRKKKYVTEKKQLVQDLIPPFNRYIHTCTLYT